jgi:hypothetical protein
VTRLGRIALVAALTLAPATGRAESAIALDYTPETRAVTLTLPEGAAPAAAPPDWLRRTGPRRFEGTLPPLSEARATAAAVGESAFILGALGWIDGAGSAPIRLSVPAGYRAVANRDLVSETQEAGRYTARFAGDAARGPVHVMAGPYTVGEAAGAGARLRTYFPPADHAAQSEAYLAAAEGYISRYSARIGAYPYPDFFVVAAPVPVGLSFGNTTFVAERILGHDYMRGRSLAHEVLHAWWGGAVGIDAETGNWAEGLTTYQADHALAAETAPDRARALRRGWLEALARGDAARRLRDFRSPAHAPDQAVGYGKAALVFHMLKAEIGAPAFEAGLRRFWSDNRGGRAGWRDLRRAFARAAGRDLDWFFDQWLDRPGLPEVRLGTAEVTATDEGYATTVTLTQAAPAWRLRVPLRLETAAGTERHVVELRGPRTEARLSSPARPRAVAVDPGFDVARHLLDGERPPTLRDALSAGRVAVHPGGEAVAEALIGAPVTRLDRDGGVPDEADAVVVAGATAEVAALRERLLPGAPPEEARAGRARAWVERDAAGRTWLFASAARPETLPEALQALRYYGGASHVVIAAEGRPRSGRWPVEASPMVVRFD